MGASPHAEPLWWQTGVIYQVYPRSFQDSNGDGIGDLPGISGRLDYLTETLGVDAIWLSPFYPSPMADFGYDVSNYVDVADIFGTLADFDELISEAHKRDLRIIIDFVPNHTSDQHPWFVQSRASRDNPNRDWYTWCDPKPDGSPPNNWLSLFGGSGWQWDDATGQYYLHRYLKEQPDLNWRNAEVKEAMFDVLRFWLDRGVDGFRIDVAHGIMKDPELRDNPPSNSDANPYKDLGDWDSQLHVYDESHADIHIVYREMRKLLDSYSEERPRMAVGEIHVFDYPAWASYFGVEQDELHLPANFGLIGAKWEASDIRRIVDTVEGVMRSGTWPTYVLGNHDEHRIASRIGEAQARLAQMLLLTLRGTPTLYYGDEVGMTDVHIAAEDEQDPWGKRFPDSGLGRDPERTPMQWDSSPNAGFCAPTVKPWLPTCDNHHQVSVESQRDDQRSILSLTRELLCLRRHNPALQMGSYRPVEAGAHGCFVYLRELGESRFLVGLNFSDDPQTVEIPGGGQGRVMLSTSLDHNGDIDLASFPIRPREGCLIRLS